MGNIKMSILEIADKIGVSASTVSRVINNRPGIAEKTRILVFETMDSILEQIFALLQRDSGFLVTRNKIRIRNSGAKKPAANGIDI